MTEFIVKPKRPVAGRWKHGPLPPTLPASGYPIEFWYHPVHGFKVLSAVEVAIDKDGIDRGPAYHVSISKRGERRVSSTDAKMILRQFDLDGAEEDNHVPHGFVRNFWRPVADRFVGMECACKAEEPAIREDKGDFVWRG
jgi:hypothetical protein